MKNGYYEIDKEIVEKKFNIKRVDIRKEYYKLLDKIKKEKKEIEEAMKTYELIGNTECEGYRMWEYNLEFIERLLKETEETNDTDS